MVSSSPFFVPKDPPSVDSAPPICQDLSIRADRLRLLGKKVLIEADARATQKVGSLWIPTMTDQAYPTSGWVIAVGPEVTDLAPGDFVVLEEEGMQVDTSYYDLFEIILKMPNGSAEAIWAEVETEPVVREQVNAYRRGGLDSIIKVIDKKAGGGISFNCSDVLDFQVGGMANPSYNLTYIPMFMLVITSMDDRPALHYFTEPDKVMAVIHY